MNKRSVIATLIITALFRVAFSGTTGKISGKIIDANTSEPVIGANIYLENTDYGAVSDVDGNYFIINVSPGMYSLVCSFIGYEKITYTGISVSVDRTSSMNFEIKPETIQGKEVIVVGERKVIEMDRTNTAAYVSSENIEKMPVQELDDLIQLQTGVVKDASGEFHIRGGRAGEIAYLIDGVPITDQYNGGSSIGLENNWVQELQVISGTFNAEYGQAQSGVVNIVTKEGAKQFKGNISVAMGDYLSTHNDVFMNIDHLNIGETDISTNLQGPFPIIPKGSFYTSLRYYTTDGWLYGQRNVRIEDTVPIQQYINQANKTYSSDQTLYGIPISDSLQTGDGEYIPMNWKNKLSFYGKLTTKLGPAKINYSLFYNDDKSKSYSDAYRYAPDGVRTNYGTSFNHILSFNHVLSNSTFYVFNLSWYSKNTQAYLFEDPLDTRYQGAAYSADGFSYGGTQKGRYDITRSAISSKFDFTSQVNIANQIKSGIELKQHNLKYILLETVAEGPTYEYPDLRIPAQITVGNDRYTVKPMEASAYIQDKIELNELIMNFGLRYDFWDPNAVVPDTLRAAADSGTIRLGTTFSDAKTQSQISPRFGLAFPISSNGVVHASYGHFFQLPRFEAIYSNYECEIELGSLQSKLGNPNLKPEKTVSYEIGLQQEMLGLFALDVTVFYKDIKNLLSQEIVSTIDKKVYARYINRDYGNVKGFTISFKKGRGYSDFMSASVDYTYQVARGNASDPNAIFTNFQSDPPKEPEKQVLPLDWDQTHTLNASLAIGNPSDWNLGVIGRFATGQPYTPKNPGSALTAQFENSDRKPVTFNIDLTFYKFVSLSEFKVKLFCKVFNLTDRLNEIKVYSGTGSADYNYRTMADRLALLRNPNFTIKQIDLRPDYYSEPRKILVGISVDF